MTELMLCFTALIVGAGFGFCGCASIARKGYLVGVVPDDNIDRLNDKVDGLEADLESAVEAAFRLGAVDWTRKNYPALYRKFVA